MALPATTSERRYGRSVPATETVLHEAVRTELATFLKSLEESGSKPLPRYVRQALRSYLRCGDFAHGFCRWTCERCQHDLLVAFSCAVRSICPSCGVRRMDEVGAELVDRILPEVPYRQYVLSVPWELRMLCATRASALSALVRSLWRSLHKELLALAATAGAETGTVTFVQRFGGSLNLHPHLHVLAPDGVFVKGSGSVRFVPIDPRAIDVTAIVSRARKSMLRWLERHGLMRESPSNETPAPDALRSCQQLGLRYRGLVSLPTPRSKDDEHRRFELTRRRYHARTDDGFDLDASVAIAQGDDLGLERLARYAARPARSSRRGFTPPAIPVLERLQKLPDGRYAYRTKYQRSGRTHRLMTGTELMARLCALVPPGIAGRATKEARTRTPALPAAALQRGLQCRPHLAQARGAQARLPSPPCLSAQTERRALASSTCCGRGRTTARAARHRGHGLALVAAFTLRSDRTARAQTARWPALDETLDRRLGAATSPQPRH